MNIGTISRQALRAVARESIENRLLVSKKIIKEVEDTPNEASHRLCQELRATLKSVATGTNATGEQVREAGSLLARVRAFDPRRNPKEPHEVEPAKLEPVKSRPSVPRVSDGFTRGFIDPIAAIARVTFKYGSHPPPWNTRNQVEVLRTALGDVGLDANAVRQLWLTLAHDFKERLVGSDMAPQTKCILACICAHANQNQIVLQTPNCLNLSEELAFRS
jgi:hypothetical protein